MGLTKLKSLEVVHRRGYRRITNQYNIAELDDLRQLVRAWELLPDAVIAHLPRKHNMVVLCRPSARVRIEDDHDNLLGKTESKSNQQTKETQ